MNDDELDPRIIAALRDVTPPDSATRDAHITAAIAASGTASIAGRATASGRTRVAILLASAAAIVFAFVAGRLSVDDAPSPIVDAATTTIPKTGVDTCRDALDADAELLHTYEVADVEYAIVGVNGQIFIMETRNCSFITQFSIGTTPPPTSG